MDDPYRASYGQADDDCNSFFGIEQKKNSFFLKSQ